MKNTVYITLRRIIVLVLILVLEATSAPFYVVLAQDASSSGSFEEVLGATESAEPTVTSEATLLERLVTPTVRPIHTDNLTSQSPIDETIAGKALKSLVKQQAAGQSAFVRQKMKARMNKKIFKGDESVALTLSYTLRDQIKELKIRHAATNEEVVTGVEEVSDDDSTTLSIATPRHFKPGKYTIAVTNNSGEKVEQDFMWGVLAINTNKSMYVPKEVAKLAFAVLDEKGEMVCNAQLSLRIKNQQTGLEDTLSTENNRITVNPECNVKDLVLKPDYEAEFPIASTGVHIMNLTAQTDKGSYAIEDSFEVKEQIDFDVERNSATRIYPPKNYPVVFNIKSEKDFEGTITEIVPESFEIEKVATEGAKVFDMIETVSSSSLNMQNVLGLSKELPLPFDDEKLSKKGSERVSLGFAEEPDDQLLEDKYNQYGVVGHDGIDFDLPMATEVLAVDGGEVVLAQENHDYGTTVVIEHSWGKTYYGHLSEILVKEGQKVQRGKKIALSGNSGLSTGSHLHFSLKPTGYDVKNGYFGKVDPAPLLGLESRSRAVAVLSAKIDEPVKVLSWKVRLKKGESTKLGYTFNAPDISPQYYTLGPLRFIENDEVVFQEARNWQIAADSTKTRVRTVEFFAGQYAGSATNQNQNAKQDFTAETFHLAESGVDIVDAYVEVFAQIGGTSSTTYASSYIYFDACIPSCTPSTVAFTTTAGLGTTSLESQTIRFRANVTTEAQLALYTGGGQDRTFQVSYCFATGATCSGSAAANIQGANAKLVVTYLYDETSATQTNTVIYPLESNTTGPVGSKTAVQAACTMDSNCPLFRYNADIPEITTQKSQFFHLQSSVNTGAGTTADLTFIPQVNGNASGSTMYIEQALSDNGGWWSWLVSGSLAGYANNSNQDLEFGNTTSSNAYVMGGENYVTYTYPRTAATKTKTVVYPVGEVQTVGSTTVSSLTGPTVYIPESGATIKRAWFRVHTSTGAAGATATTLNLTTKVGANAETGTTGYSIASDAQGVSDEGYFIHIIPSADYTELAAATASSGKAVQMTADWVTTARGAVSAELVVTYTYTGDTNGYMTTQNLFAGQMTAAAATSFTADFMASGPVLPETSGTITIRGASQKMNAKDTSATASQTVGLNLSTTETCTPSNTSTTNTDSEITSVMLWKSLTSTVLNTDSTVYLPCYSSSQASIYTGILQVTHQVDRSAFTQNVYRWYQNADSVQPGSALANENTAATNVSTSNAIRLRQNITVASKDLAVTTQSFKLQYATSTSGPWSDVAGLANWYNASWTYRKPVQIDNSSNGSSLTDYQLLLTVDTSTLITAAKMKTDCADLRITDSDGTTLLSYWIETSTCNTAETKVWIKVPSIAASGYKHIYLYYGNASASAVSSGSDTFILFDDFDDNSLDTAKWTTVSGGGGSVSETNQELAVSTDGTNRTYLRSLDTLSAPYVMDYQAKRAENIEAQIHWDGIIQGTYDQPRNGYTAPLYRSWDANYSLTIDEFVNGTNTLIASKTPAQFTLNTSYHAWKTIARSTGIDVYYEGILQLTVEDSTRTSGYVGLSGRESPSGVTAYYDDVRIRVYTTTEPSTIAFDEETSSPTWKFKDNTTPTDGTQITTALLTGSTPKESYEENNPTVLNPAAITTTQNGEWDFALDPVNALSNTTYYFRMVEADGLWFGTYTNYPELTTSSGVTSPTNDQLMRHGKWFSSGVRQPFTF